MRYLLAMACCLLSLVLITPAFAAKVGTVARLEGQAYVVRANSSHYLACWSQLPNGKSRLYVIETNKGDVQTVATEDLPGGICWVPNRDQLLWCYGVYVEPIKATRVYYMLYDIAAKDSTKIVEVTDFTEDYQADMLAADDGSLIFHVTMDGNSMPSFNVYYPPGQGHVAKNSDSGKGTVQLLQADAKIGAQYDLSSDGAHVYWLLHNPDTGTMSIASWSINGGKYDGLYEYNKKSDPADDHMFLKVDTTKHQAAAIVTSAKDPRLQLCLYMLDKLSSMPIYLQPGEQVDYFDWKGRSGLLYALVSSGQGKQFSIEEIDPLTSKRTQLYSTTQQLYSVEYGPEGNYFFTMVDNKNAKKPVTDVLRLK
jgi:hypothetical protein